MGLHCAAYRNGSRIPFRFRRGGLHKSVAPSNHEYVESQLSNEIDNRINLRSRITYILISKLRTKLWISLLMPLYVQSFIRYWKDSKSRDLPYHSFSKMQLIYLVIRTWKIFWSTLLLELVLKNRDSMNLYSYSFWSSLIGENWKQFHWRNPRGVRDLPFARYARRERRKKQEVEEQTATERDGVSMAFCHRNFRFPGERISFHGSNGSTNRETGSSGITAVSKQPRPHPLSSSPFPFVSRSFHSFDDRPISLSLFLVSYSFSQQRGEAQSGFDELSILLWKISGWRKWQRIVVIRSRISGNYLENNIVVCRTKLFEFFPRAIFKIFEGIIILILFFL